MLRQGFFAAILVLAICSGVETVFAQPKPAATPKPTAKGTEVPKPATDADSKSKSSPKSGPAPKPVAIGGDVSRTDQLKLGWLAPEEGVLFLASNGWATAAANSTNKSERLWSEQSVQDFIQQLNDEIKKTIEKQAQVDATASLIATTIPVFLKAAVQHPLAISLISFTTEEIPNIRLAVVIDTESDADQVRESFEKLIAAAPKQGADSLSEETIEGAVFYRPNVPGKEASLAPQFGMLKSYLILTMGAGTTGEVIQKMKQPVKAATWLQTAIRDLKVERPSLMWHVDVASIWKTVDHLVQDPMVRTALDASGLLTVKQVSSASGLDATGTVNSTIIETTEAPRGVLALLPNKPLLASDLKGIPANPAQAAVIRFDLELLTEQVLKMTDQVHPMPRQQFDMISTQGEGLLGFSIKEDLLKAFGDVWSFYISGSEVGSGFVPGAVITVTAKDAAKLNKVQESLVALAKSNLQQMGRQAPLSVVDFTARGVKGYRLQFNNVPLPLAPSWVISKDQFILGINPQLVTAHLGTANAAASLADNEDVQAALKRDPRTVMLSYQDPRPGIQQLYGLVNMFSPVALGQLQQQGIDFNFPPLPPYSDIEPFLSPSVSTFSQSQNGWRGESHGVVPSVSTVGPAGAAVLVALLLPAVQQAREAARRTMAKNNLRQIALAMHNFESTHRRFPARILADSAGNPGLSWRVQLLPFLDQKELYDEFHLDEPWDSEHNKALIARMPAIYGSASDAELTRDGKTRFVVLVGDGTLFDGDEGPSIADVTDGMSNTIMAVETTPTHAVTWTEPEDLDVDFEDLLEGLKGARAGGFHALMSDGVVRFVSEKINSSVLKGLMTRAGDEDASGFHDF